MNTFNIVIDADDVLENLLIVWVNELNERYNLNYVLDDMKEWSMTKNIPELTEEEIFAPVHEDALWEKINTMPYAQKALQIFEDMGHEVYICTRHTIFETLRTKLFRLQELFPMVSADHYIIAADKNMIKADIMIDDGVHNLMSIDHPCVKILFDQPHNRHIEAEYTDMIRATSWWEIVAIISALSNTRAMANWIDVVESKYECEGCWDEIE